MRVLACAAAAGAIMAAAAPAEAARTADYALSEEQYRTVAANLKVGDFPAMPGREQVDVVIDPAGGAVDHRVRIVGIACSAWNVDNPLSLMIARTMTAWDRDGTLAAPAASGKLVRLKLDEAATNLRCVEVRELKTRCMSRASVSGVATVEEPGKEPRAEPISVAVEQIQSMGGLCNGLAQGTGLIGRELSIALAERLRALAGAS